MDSQKSADANDGRKTLVEEGTEFRGSLASNCPVVVRGKIEGDINAPSLDVSSSGSIRGRLKVGAFVGAGELSGELDAESVQLSGVIKDQTVVRARSLDVSLGPNDGRPQTVFGECLLEIGDMPNKEAAVSASMNAVNRGSESPSAQAPEAAPPPSPAPAPDAPVKDQSASVEAAQERPSDGGRNSSDAKPPVSTEASPSTIEHGAPPASTTAGSSTPAESAPATAASTSDPASAIIRALSDPADSEPNSAPSPARRDHGPQASSSRRQSSSPPKRIS